MASGTGALLTAVYRRIAERHRIAGGDNADIHRSMVEDVLIGCDIMPAAVHLTAARLSGEHPDIDYKRTRTWILPYGKQETPGGSEIKIGSLDLLRGNQTPALWGDGTYAVTAYGDAATTTAEIPDRSLDVVIMNPPFCRRLLCYGSRCCDGRGDCRGPVVGSARPGARRPAESGATPVAAMHRQRASDGALMNPSVVRGLDHAATSFRGAGTGVGEPAAGAELLAAVYRGRLGSQSPREPLRFSSVCPGSIRQDHGSETPRRYQHFRVCGWPGWRRLHECTGTERRTGGRGRWSSRHLSPPPTRTLEQRM